MKKQELKKNLEKKLRKVWNNDEFVLGIMTFARDEEGYQFVSDYIDSHPSAESGRILFELCLFDQPRHPEAYFDLESTKDKVFKDLDVVENLGVLERKYSYLDCYRHFEKNGFVYAIFQDTNNDENKFKLIRIEISTRKIEEKILSEKSIDLQPDDILKETNWREK